MATAPRVTNTANHAFFGHVDQLRPRPRGVYGSVEAVFAGTCPAYEAMLASEDAREGMQAFIEKRPPVWRGR